MKKRMYFFCVIVLLFCFSTMSFASEIVIQKSLVESKEDIINATSSTAISDGIKSFQRYINNNLPISYLGTTLDIDGSCGPLTQTAIIKLVQYRLNQTGASLNVDGGFGVQSQAAFQQYVGTIKRYDSGNWVYILQGLLYCHGYNPNGFDGSYGVNGGTGCLNAVNSYKTSNAIGGISGEVDIDTMRFLLWRDDCVNIWTNAGKYTTLANGTSGTVNYANDMDCFLYYAPQSQSVYIYSTGTVDTRGTVYSVNLSNKTRTWLQNDEDSGESKNFKMKINMTAGTTYLIVVEGKSATSGSYNLFVTDATIQNIYAGLNLTTESYTGVSAHIKTPTQYPYVGESGESCWVSTFNNKGDWYQVGIRYYKGYSTYQTYIEKNINGLYSIDEKFTQSPDTVVLYKLAYDFSDSKWHVFINSLDFGNVAIGADQYVLARCESHNSSIAMGPFTYYNLQTRTNSGWAYNTNNLEYDAPYKVSLINGSKANFQVYGPVVS